MKSFIILISSLLVQLCYSQVTVSHFNSSWNIENNFDISKLKECETASVSICEYPDLQKQYEIKVVPTIIVFEDGEEIKRFEANIMMELVCSRKDIQAVIDSIYLKRFE